MTELFSNNGALIVFLHVLSAFIWVGGMIAIRLAVHPVISRGGVTAEQMLKSDVMISMLEPKQRLGITLQIMGRLFNLVMPFIVIIFATGLIMAVATGGHHGDLKELFLSKEILWTIMVVNYTYMYVKRAKAWKLFAKGEIALAKAQLRWMPYVLLPLNIVLGLVALWMGVNLRGM
ncbi:hypothetical protein [Sulfurovum sp.]|uniref:hypothetical protein n=1 Tax=Sulfurovum sp. TaxID=1969726 RepID=UPI002867FF4C|nr:hypothetical protein [Sulfurovum sp.]